MAESRKDRQKREAKEAYASVWKRPERKSPVTEEGERSERVGPPQLARALNVRVTHPVFELVREAVRRDGFTRLCTKSIVKERFLCAKWTFLISKGCQNETRKSLLTTASDF